MADAQADNAQGQQAPQGDAAPKTGDEPRTIPEPRFKEVIAERDQTREELARYREELAATRQELAGLKAAQQAPQDQPDPNDDDPEKVFARVVKKTVDPLTGVVARLYDEVDALKFKQHAAGLSPEDVTAAEKLRLELQQKGVYATRDDVLALSLGRKALQEREQAAQDEANRIKANAFAYAGEDRPGSYRPSPEPDIDHLPPAERAAAYAKRLGDQPI